MDFVQGSQVEYHFGLNYVVSPAPDLNPSNYVTLISTLQESGIHFLSQSRDDRSFTMARESDAPGLMFQIKQDPQHRVGQFLVLEPRPVGLIQSFKKRAALCMKTAGKVWKHPFQIIARDACIRQLFECRVSEHAFQFIWEKRLAQKAEDLSVPFQRGLVGGGLRFVFAPKAEESDSPRIEVKVESFLENPRLLFLETQFFWGPWPQHSDFRVEELLDRIYRFATSEVLNFVRGSSV